MTRCAAGVAGLALPGAEQFAARRSYLATTARHDIDGLDALTRLTTGNP